MCQIEGKIKVIDQTLVVGTNGFRKRDIVVTTNEQYPQDISVQFIQDKTDLLDKFNVGEDVKISVNLRGREWINPEGVSKYFNTIQGWAIKLLVNQVPTQEDHSLSETQHLDNQEDADDLPF